MQGGPVLPAIAELQRHPDPGHPQFRPLYSGQPVHAVTPAHGPNVSPPLPPKRAAFQPAAADPAKKQSKWTPEEDNLTIELRGQGMKWDDIAKQLPGRSSISCRLRYQNYLEKRSVWDEEKKNRLARLYARFKDQMWQKVATEMGIPWRSAESMHWQLGEQEMSARANAPVFQLHPSATANGSPTQPQALPAPQSFTPLNASQLVPTPPSQHQVPQQQQHQHQPLPPAPNTGPIHSSHHRSSSNSSQGRRRSSLSMRRTDARSRSIGPHQLGHPLPQLQPATEADLLSGPRTTSYLETPSRMKREGDGTGFVEPYLKRKREGEADSLRAGSESRSLRSPDRSSQRSGTGSVKSAKRDDPEEQAQTSKGPPPATG